MNPFDKMYFFAVLFNKYNFQLNGRQVPAPFVPDLDDDLDLSNFDPQFTMEPVELTPDDV